MPLAPAGNGGAGMRSANTQAMRAFTFVGNLLGAGLVAMAIPLVILAVGIPIAIVLTVILGWLRLA